MSATWRRFLVCGYLLLALGAPLMVLLVPGEPAVSINETLLDLASDDALNPGAILGQGADKYDKNVFERLAGSIASVAADYPDGSNAVVAVFDTPASAATALGGLKDMIPHQHEERDLWATHFTSDSGEYIMLSQAGRNLVMIISERESMARQRLAALPVLNYNPRPGLGAVLRQQSGLTFTLVVVFYLAVQWLFVRRLFAWAGLWPLSLKNRSGSQAQGTSD